MRKEKFGASALWQNNNKKFVTKKDVLDLSSFKSSKVNHKITLWDPETNGVRYVKTLIYNLCFSLTAGDWGKLRRIKCRDLGNPISVKFNNSVVCLDYLQALFEMKFISKKLKLNDKKILEIGAGYGRTCHAIISNYNIQSYHIVDLENCLNLSKRYLQKVLTRKQFSKITFLSNNEMPEMQNYQFDLSINIDSFAEMDKKVVLNYLKYINNHCRYFYVKNPIGKYRDKSLDNHAGGKRAVANAMKTGVLRHIVDINNNHSIKQSSEKFVRAYRPGKSWRHLSDSWARPWSYYWQAIFQK